MIPWQNDIAKLVTNCKLTFPIVAAHGTRLEPKLARFLQKGLPSFFARREY